MVGDRKIEELAHRLRCWIDEQDRRALPGAFAKFPAGACEFVSCLLALWLEENGERGFVLFFDLIGDYEHVCLVRGDLIVDITGDQFGWPPVIVTRGSTRHRQPDATHSGEIEPSSSVLSRN